MTLGSEDDDLLAAQVARLNLTEAAVLRLALRLLSGQPGPQALLSARAPRFTKESK